MFKTSSQLRLENLALRQQLAVLRRSAPKRLKLTPADRIFWVWLRSVWSDWKSALMIVKAETVVAWHLHDAPAFVCQHQKHIQDLEPDRRHREEVYRNQS